MFVADLVAPKDGQFYLCIGWYVLCQPPFPLDASILPQHLPYQHKKCEITLKGVLSPFLLSLIYLIR